MDQIQARRILMRNICDTIINKYDGFVFGGYVRDTIRQLYCTHQTQLLIATGLDPSLMDTEEFLPEMADRFQCPVDIDCMIQKKHLDSFKNEFLRQHMLLSVVEIKSDNLYEFKSLNDEIEYQHQTWELKTQFDTMQHLLGWMRGPDMANDNLEYSNSARSPINIKFTLDVLVITDEMPTDPFLSSTADFRCNSLFFKQMPFGINYKDVPIAALNIIEDNALDAVNKAISDIHSKIAHVVCDTNKTRIKKMIDKGYTICNMPVNHPFETYINKTDDICSICLEIISYTGIQTSCCHAKLHYKCFDDIVNHGLLKCPICKKIDPIDGIIDNMALEHATMFIDEDANMFIDEDAHFDTRIRNAFW